MADSVHIDITGDRQVGLLFETFPDELYGELRDTVNALSIELLALIQAATPSLTGRLRSQERLRLFTDKTSIKGYVDIAGQGSGNSSDFAKAGALEYGAKEQELEYAMRLDHYFHWQLNRPVTVMVDRLSGVPEFAFERGPLAAMQPEIIARLNAIVEKATAQANA